MKTDNSTTKKFTSQERPSQYLMEYDAELDFVKKTREGSFLHNAHNYASMILVRLNVFLIC